MTVEAIDLDENENGRITYHFKADNKNVQEVADFSIDPNKGEIRTIHNLDRELKSQYEVSHNNFLHLNLCHLYIKKLCVMFYFSSF